MILSSFSSTKRARVKPSQGPVTLEKLVVVCDIKLAILVSLSEQSSSIEL